MSASTTARRHPTDATRASWTAGRHVRICSAVGSPAPRKGQDRSDRQCSRGGRATRSGVKGSEM
eukprot:2610114-Alexandrium_andersonii.AAC.1